MVIFNINYTYIILDKATINFVFQHCSWRQLSPFTKSDDFDLLVHYYQTSSLGHLCGTKTKEQKAQIPFRKFMADSWKFVFKVESSRFNSSIPST